MNKDFTFLFVGDVFAKSGRDAVSQFLPALIKQHQIDFVIVNAENATHGRSISVAHHHALKDIGVDVFTMGNHVFALPETNQYLEVAQDILRPANYSALAPGKGTNKF